MPNAAVRMAWLAKHIPALPRSGIVYTLTQRDAERVTEWLNLNGIHAKAYHSKVSNTVEHQELRDLLEQELLSNKIKVLVATVALGMGFDKPDLGFVIHYQRPSSVVHYYQQVGRAGRAIQKSYGILLGGQEDDRIADYFIKHAFPPQQHIQAILMILMDSEEGLSIPELQKHLNLKKSQIEKTIKFLTVESPSPITKIKSKWVATAQAIKYTVNQNYIDEITAIRRHEQMQMQAYMQHSGCLMAFLQNALDDKNVRSCGKCSNCRPANAISSLCDDQIVKKASFFLKRNYQKIVARKQWPAKNMFNHYPFDTYRIPLKLQAMEGRALSLYRDAGWGELVAKGKYEDGAFSPELLDACVEMLKIWNPDPKPTWLCCVPSLKHPTLVPSFAEQLADRLGIPFIRGIKKQKDNMEQKRMENSYQQAKNLDGVFLIDASVRNEPCLLIDDMVDSGWTFTIVSALLRKAGCSHVFPLALAMNAPKLD